MYTVVVLLSCVCALQFFLVYTPLGCICKLESILYCHLCHCHTTVKLLFDSHSSQTMYNNLSTHKRHQTTPFLFSGPISWAITSLECWALAQPSRTIM